ncbi:phage major capsid protein [Ensifer sp. IC4062]|nr:phage major capsid protein [Ensifer sp. IC4062]
MATTLTDLETKLVDLKQLCVGISRAIRKSGGDKAERQRGQAFVALAAQAIFHHLKRPDLVDAWQQRAAVSPAQTTVPGWAQELATSVTADFVMSLTSGIHAFPSIAQRAFAIQLAADMRAVLAGEASAFFVGEGEPIGLAVAEVSAMQMRPYSVKVLSTFTEELAEKSQPSVEALLRRILGDAVGACLDEVFFGSQANTIRAPRGILHGVTATAPGASFAEDVKNLVAALGGAGDPIFVTSPSTRAGIAAAAGGLLGFDYLLLSSSAVPDDRLVALDRDGLIVGFGGQPTFKTSREASLIEQDQAGVVDDLLSGSPVRSLWQTNSASLKATLPVSWMLRPGAAAFTEPLSW